MTKVSLPTKGIHAQLDTHTLAGAIAKKFSVLEDGLADMMHALEENNGDAETVKHCNLNSMAKA
ncbi:MAG: Uncharacterised protein [Synechococcus sp. MIT S9220]|nr:MAG: Uncharacterised protein [Synechococcus sp. MIT S9220]